MKSKIPIRRTVQFKYSCVLFLCTVFLIAIALGVSADRHRAGVAVYMDRKHERQATFDVITKLNSQSLEGLTIENTYWDDMVSYISKPSADFESSILRTQLDTYKANAIWTYNKKYELVSNTNNFSYNNIDLTLNLDAQKINTMFAHSYLAHYYTMTNAGLMEVFGATVHNSEDAAHTTPNEGYFYIARVLNSTYAARLSSDTKDTVKIVNIKKEPNKQPNPAPQSGNISFYKDLSDNDGSLAGRLHVTYQATAISLFFTSLNRVILLSVLAYLLLAVIIYVVLRILIVKPLSTIYRALSTDTTAYLDKLITKETEFGRIALLIDSAAKQKDEVFRSSEQAKQAQLLLKARTDELERINGLMVEREMQMVQLEKENKELTARLDKPGTDTSS